jgi:2-C-methyl-D-erythritol 4-phosphate cytidylyltransferase
MNHNISVVLLGAGRSKRFISSQIKQNILVNKRSILDYSRLFFNKYFPKSNIFIVVNKKVIINKLKTNEKKIYGSSSRLKSLHLALKNILQNNIQTKYTLIHDIARPILNITDIKRLVASMKLGVDASTLGYPLTNALKEVKKNKVHSNLYRDNLWSSFTPQIFKTDKLYESIEKIINDGYDIDDDIEALMMCNFKCSIIRSSPDNIKITFLEDIEVIRSYYD